MFCLVGCVTFVLLYAQRVGMSVAIVCMINHTAVLDLQTRAAEAGQSTLQPWTVTSSSDDVTQGNGAPALEEGGVCARRVVSANQSAAVGLRCASYIYL